MAEEENKKESNPIGDIVKQTTNDVLIPKAKDTVNSALSEMVYAIGDWIVGIIGRKIFGPEAKVNTRGGSSNRTDYTKASHAPVTNVGLRSSEDLQEIYINSEADARDIKDSMIERITRYSKVSVGFYYDKASQKSSSKKVQSISSDYRYGWTDPGDIHYSRNRFGFYFDLPKPKPLS